MSPAIVVVLLGDALLVVKCVDEDIFFFWAPGELLEAFDVRDLVIESRCKHQCLVSEGFAGAEFNCVAFRVDFVYSIVGFKLAPVINLSGNGRCCCSLDVKMAVAYSEVELSVDSLVFLRNNGNFQVLGVVMLLDVLCQRYCIDAA